MSQTTPSPRLTRRTLLQGAAAAAGAAALTSGASASNTVSAATKAALAQDDVVLFQGDSITDAHRDKKAEGANDFGALGRGYANMISAALLGAHPALRLQCYNRGISGHKVPDLQGRWQKDTIDLKPAVLSILIGVDDIWHKLNGKYDGTVKDYQEGFTKLLDDTREALPEVRLVICEPFVLRCGAVNDAWFPEFDERRAVARAVSDAAGAMWVPFQSIFDDAVSEVTPPEYWAADGVHPTTAGHALMARTWMETTGLG